MLNENYEKFNNWFNRFISLHESSHNNSYPFPVYNNRFSKDSIKSQLSVIYTNYITYMDKESIDKFGKVLLIDKIIMSRYNTLQKLGSTIQEQVNSVDVDLVRAYTENVIIINEEILLLKHEKELIERQIRKNNK